MRKAFDNLIESLQPPVLGNWKQKITARRKNWNWMKKGKFGGTHCSKLPNWPLEVAFMIISAKPLFLRGTKRERNSFHKEACDWERNNRKKSPNKKGLKLTIKTLNVPRLTWIPNSNFSIFELYWLNQQHLGGNMQPATGVWAITTGCSGHIA